MQRTWVEIAASCDCKRSPIGAQSHPKGAIIHGDVGTSRAQELASGNEDTARVCVAEHLTEQAALKVVVALSHLRLASRQSEDITPEIKKLVPDHFKGQAR